jgi:4-hydroxybutyryl-CoA dehydratase/vinylacetyl-CoA-Delta-isomerase
MGLRTVEQYKESLKDGREVYMYGEKVKDVTTHRALKTCVDTMALDYEAAELPKYKDLAIVFDPELGEEVSRYYYVPKTGEDLLKATDLIIEFTAYADGYIPLAKDIGADALNAIQITANMIGNKDYIDRINNFRKYLMKEDTAIVSAVTDVKGDRLLRPSDPKQVHPDFYVRVVDKNSKGIIVRGAKMHITGAAYSNEIFAIPCRAMTEQDSDYAVAFAIPCNTKGLKQICRPIKSEIGAMEFPCPRPLRMHTDSLIIFDDVLVPWERVFLCGEWQHAGLIALHFGLLHRRTGCAYRIPISEMFVGMAYAIAEYNGVLNVPHIREKLTDAAMYLQTLKALTRSACLDYVMHGGMPVPNPVTTNIGKYHFADKYHDLVKVIQDISGGSLITKPTYKDWQNPETHDYMKKYLSGKSGIPAEHRLRMYDLIRRWLASEYEVMVLHGEGSIMTQRMTILAEAKEELLRCKKIAEDMAGIK